MLTLKVLKLTEMENHLEEIARFTEIVFFFLLLKYANFQQTLALMIVIMQIILYPIF